MESVSKRHMSLYILHWFSIYKIRNVCDKFRDKNYSVQLAFTNLCVNNFEILCVCFNSFCKIYKALAKC